LSRPENLRRALEQSSVAVFGRSSWRLNLKSHVLIWKSW